MFFEDACQRLSYSFDVREAKDLRDSVGSTILKNIPTFPAFNTRKKEHLRNTKTAAKGSRIANHAWSNNHAIDFENASVIDKGTFLAREKH